MADKKLYRQIIDIVIENDDHALVLTALGRAIGEYICCSVLDDDDAAARAAMLAVAATEAQAKAGPVVFVRRAPRDNVTPLDDPTDPAK